MCIRDRKDGSVQYSYRCGGYASRVNSCTSHTISADNVEALILSAVKRFSRFVLNDEKALAVHCRKAGAAQIALLPYDEGRGGYAHPIQQRQKSD